MIKYMNGDLLESGCDYICHQVNCQGAMRSGIAKQIRERWPIVFERYQLFLHNECKVFGVIQSVQVNDNQKVINMYSQDDYGYDGRRYTSYDAFHDALCEIKKYIPHDKRIGFPYNIGCDRGGANWNIISAMIEEILKDHTVEIWKLGE